MDLSAECIHRQLEQIAELGWDSAAGTGLLDQLRRCVVRPLVRRAGLTGPAAEQAEASGWAAAWDALRRSSARTAENPAGMVWVAATRAIRSEVDGALGSLVAPEAATSGVGGTDPRTHAAPALSRGHQSAQPAMPVDPPSIERTALGPLLDRVIRPLVHSGWEPVEVRELVAALAEHSRHSPAVGAVVRWRLVARLLGVPEWRARRLSSLLVGGTEGPGVLVLMLRHGPGILDHEAVTAAVLATTNSWSAVPEAHLAYLRPALPCTDDDSVPTPARWAVPGTGTGDAPRVAI
jgi:hypothetical protein